MWALRRLDMRLLQCALCFYLSVQICDSTQQHHRDITAKNTATGCLHNNTMFADTSIIPSTEPCLLCKCANKNLVCVRRVCKDQPYPPPRSCILVHKKSLCCPYLSCSKYHINFYKNKSSEKHRYNQLHVNHDEKVLEKSSRTDDGEQEMNGGCIESGSLYASGSAMVRSSSSLCSYCYCLNGQQKCIKPKCELQDTKCKPIFMDASCCPVKYDCSNNSTTTLLTNDDKLESRTHLTAKRKNRSNGCFEREKFYQEGEKLPSDVKRPCEMCYCIKGFRKCVVKKCAPLIRGCVPKIPKEGNCCPTSYDCSRSLKPTRTRQIRQKEEDDEPEEESDSIDFFSLLFGSDDPVPEEAVTDQINLIEATTLQPFKALPSTEKSFFDFIRAGLEIIDANADKIGSRINDVTTTAKSVETTDEEATVRSNIPENFTENFVEIRQTPRTTSITQSTHKPETTASTTIKLPAKQRTSSTEATTSSPKLTTTVKTPSTTTSKRVASTAGTTPKPSEATAKLKVSPTTISTSSTRPRTTMTSAKKAEMTTTTSKLRTTSKLSTRTAMTTETATPKVLIETTSTPPTARTTAKFIQQTSTTEGHQDIHQALYNAVFLSSDKKVIEADDNEAETLPNIEIIPFVAHDAIDKDKFAPYLKPHDNLEKDYFASEKEKPFRYNNKFIHHSYDDSADYVYTNPHERIDNGPYYFESNDNQFDSFSPPSEHDFLGGFSPKESIYEVSTIASELPLKNNEFLQKPLDAPAIHEHKSNVTLTEKTLSSHINQTSESDDMKQNDDVIPDFKKISSNFTSIISDLLQRNALEEAATVTTTKRTLTTTTAATTTSTSHPIRSIINDDEFIIKHLRAPTAAVKVSQGVTEIFSKPTAPTMNGLLKLAGCNIYGQMYAVGKIIAELSNACLECKCLPDIGVGCSPKC